MPASKPDFDVELRQQLLDRFLWEYEKDRRDGKTVRGLHDALQRHIDEDRQQFSHLADKITDARLETARHEGMLVTETGRHIIPPPMQTINIESSARSKRPSHPSIVERLLERKAAAILIALVTLLIHAILRALPKIP